MLFVMLISFLMMAQSYYSLKAENRTKVTKSILQPVCDRPGIP